jgi:uncharacterized iron-regulated membrane protein
VKQPQLVPWRKAIFQVHLWTGVLLGLYLIAISVSGSALVFERELMNDAPKPLEGGYRGTQRLSYAALAEEAMKLHAGETLDSIDVRTNNRRVVLLTLKSQSGRHRNLFVDAYSGTVLADSIVEERHAVVRFLERLHNELLSGEQGEMFNGAGGALLFVLAATGIIIWWPGIRNWTRALKVKWGASWKRVLFDLHSAVGLWTLVVVAMWGLSGFYFAYPQVVNNAFRIFAKDARPKQSAWKPSETLLSLDAYLQKADQLFPDARLAYLYMDVYRPGGQVAVFLSRNPERPLTLLEDIVRLDPGTGEVLAIETSRRWSLKEKIALGSYSIHFGDFGGTASKAAWVLLGLAPAALAVSGYVMWWNRVLSKKWAGLKRRQTVVKQAVVSASEE